MSRSIVGAFIAGMLGGFLGVQGSRLVPAAAAYPPPGNTLAENLTLVGPHGRPYAKLKQGNGEAAELAFFNSAGIARLRLGLAPNGLPYIGLMSDVNDRVPRVMLQLVGKNQSASLIFKDKGAKERLIMGLDADRPEEEPFLVYFDKSGAKHVVFGRY